MKFALSVLTMIAAVATVLLLATRADAHLIHPKKPVTQMGLTQQKHYWSVVVLHDKYVVNHGKGAPERSHAKSLRWASGHLKAVEHKMYVGSLGYWIARQIWAATDIARHASVDPWPNCPDPFFNGASWNDTVNCENGGNWYDSPGYFRCGLQFEPSWEHVYGRLCP